MKQLSDPELLIIANIINEASRKGLFHANDMLPIGNLYNKIIALLPKEPIQSTAEGVNDGKE